MTESKPAIRRMMLAKREALPADVLAQAAVDVLAALRVELAYQEAHHVGVYMAHRGEVNPIECVHDAWASGKACYLPVVGDDGSMQWRAYVADSVLIKNRYGIFEPAEAACLPASALDIVLLPMVAFNTRKQRLGYGGGYFDRCFTSRTKSYLIGLAYAWQLNDDWKAEATDMACDLILTV